MRHRKRHWNGTRNSLLQLLVIAAACNGRRERELVLPAAGDSTAAVAVARLIGTGNSIYAQKTGYQSFARSLKYYDSAQAIADRSGDTSLLAETAFAKGRVYDAWNREPQKTIALFTEAALLFKALPDAQERHWYVKHLVAHAYDKIQDSARATGVLRDLYRELAGKKDTALLHRLSFTAEMALIATEVRAYPLADSILRTLTRRAWIANDPKTYDYLSHYYLTQSRLDAFWRKPSHSYYLDSLLAVFDSATNNPDRAYYSFALATLYRANGDHQKSNEYYVINNELDNRLNNQADIDSMQRALQQSERMAETHRAEYQEALRANRLRIIWLLSALLSVITGLSLYLYRQARRSGLQAKTLSRVNSDLDGRIAQVELLNKEIQHRVKNNLHMIYSLLQLQERRTESDEVVEALQAARLRVESVAALHNQLLAGKGNLDLAEYIKKLISSVVNCLSDDLRVITHITTDELKISEDNYFELSLILNEWVTNSIKYAARASHLLEINVSVKNTPDGVCIDYSDSGSGLGNPGDPGLGMQIITLLSVQMGARLTTTEGQPYHYQLSLPNEP